MDVSRRFQVGEWRVDPALDEIRAHERSVKLEPRMMRLLCCLAERPGEVVPTQALLDRVWPGVIVGPSSVYQAVAQLRRELGDRETPPQYIATVARKGYRLVAPVSAGPDAGTGPLVDGAAGRLAAPEYSSAAAGAEAGRAAPARGRARWIVSLAALAGLAATAAGYLLWPRPPAPPRPAPAIAVLPFADLSIDGDDEAFCAGVTDEILNTLARVPGLRVIGRTSSSRFAGAASDAREIGRELGVTHVVEGSVRRAGSRLRVNVQLVATADGFEVWANSFDRPPADAMAIQSDIARAVVAALAIQLSPDAEQRLGRVATADVSAYELYLLGRHQQLKRTPAALARAVEYHRAAIEADPGFALAHAGLADAYMAQHYYDNRPLDEVAPRVQAEVDAALRLDPELAEGYAAWAVLLTEQWRMPEAIRALERALSINANYSEAWLRLGAAREYAGEPRLALEAYDQVASIDPLHTVMHVRRCLALQNLGQYAAADDACQRAFELQPEIPNALWARGLNALAQGDLATAVARYREALERGPKRHDIRAELAVLYLDLGMIEAAAAELERLDDAAGDFEGALRRARLKLAAGGKDAALRELRAIPADRADADARVEAAALALAAGDAPVAERFAGAVRPAAGAGELLQPGLYRTRWGGCEFCTMALLEDRRGNPAEARRLRAALAEFLDRMERQGHAWHAIHYLRGTLAAQEGDFEAALAALERAVATGWRRGWWMRLDPSLAPLRTDPRFTQLLATLDASAEQARQRLQTAR